MLLLLVACTDFDSGKTADPSGDTGATDNEETGGTDDSDTTDTAPTDADADGSPADLDCDDTDPTVNPAATEICNTIDDDCDGAVDEDLGTAWYEDLDGDGAGDPSPSVTACTAPEGWVATGDDCDDGDPGCHPGAAETCDGVDEDCDGAVDNDPVDPSFVWSDADGDNYGDPSTGSERCPDITDVDNAEDCDDTDPTIHPDAVELCDSVENDCDGLADDADPDVVAPYAWYADADGDGDGDGSATLACLAPTGTSATATDCDDTDPAVFLGAAELCNAVDDDCDGAIDEGVPTDGAGCQEPDAPTWDDAVGIVHITVRTGSGTNDGTNDAQYACLNSDDCFALNAEDWDDNNAGMTDESIYEGQSLDRGTLDSLVLQTLTGTDMWKPECVSVSLDGEPFACNDGLSASIGDGTGESMSWTGTVSNDCLGCYDAPLTHGPMVGATGADRTTIWYRTDATRRVALRVATTEAELITADPVHVRWPAAEHDFTDTAEISGLTADTAYWYDLEIEGTRYGPWTLNTLPETAAPLRIAFGSCARSDDQPLFSVIDALDPDLMLFVGDNHYGNTANLNANRRNYRWTLERPERAALLANTPTLATWDDHDYVGNDTTGADEGKENALQAFTEYWANGGYGTDEVAGVFSVQDLGDVTVVLIDDRYWRGLDDSILGDAQEAWFFEALRASDATFTLVVSGSQWSLQGSADSWAAYPDAQARFLELLADEDIGGVVALSGDIHRSEFRLLEGASGGYDLPELTSSPLANTATACNSDTDVLACYGDGPSFIAIDVDTSSSDPTLTANIYDELGAVQETWTILRSELE